MTLYKYPSITAAPPEGTAIKSTGEAGASKFLREDGDNSCSWQTPAGGGAGKLELIDHRELTNSGAVTFSSISGYKSLFCIFNLSTSTDASINFLLNGDTGANYDFVRIQDTAVTNVSGGNKFEIDCRTIHGTSGRVFIPVNTVGTDNNIQLTLDIVTHLGRWNIYCGTWHKGTAGAVTSLSFTPSAGTISGFITLYGYKET